MKKILLFSLGFSLLLGAASAREAVFSMGYSISKAPSGALLLTVTTDTVDFGPWLGVSFYPPQQGKEEQAAAHLTFPVKPGKLIKEIVIEPRYNNGTFEIAVWGRRIPKEECTRDDAFCKEHGFRLQNMYSYAWGILTAP